MYSLRNGMWSLGKCLVFLLIGFMFAEQLYKDPAYGIAWLGLALCIGYIAYTLIIPKKSYVKLMSSQFESFKEDEYTLTLGEDRLTLFTLLQKIEGVDAPESSEKEYLFSDKHFRVYEKGSIILLTSIDANNIIPKDRLTDEELERLTAVLREALGKRYTTKTERALLLVPC